MEIDFGEIVNCFDFSDHTLAVGGESGKIDFYDFRYISPKQGCISQIVPHANVVKSLQYKGNRLVSGGYDQKVVCWDTKENKQMFQIGTAKVNSLAFDDDKIIVGDSSKRVMIFDLTKKPSYQRKNREDFFYQRMKDFDSNFILNLK